MLGFVTGYESAYVTSVVIVTLPSFAGDKLTEWLPLYHTFKLSLISHLLCMYRHRNHWTNLLSVNFNVSHIVFKNGRNVYFRKLVFAEHNEQTSFATGTVTNNYQLLPQSRHRLSCNKTQTKMAVAIVTASHKNSLPAMFTAVHR